MADHDAATHERESVEAAVAPAQDARAAQIDPAATDPAAIDPAAHEAVAIDPAPIDPAAINPAPVGPAAHAAAGIDPAAREALFEHARTHYAWTARDVSDGELRAVFDTMKMGPTSANSSPARFVFLRTSGAKERLRPTLSSGNVDKAMAAPVVAIVAYDPHFYDHLSRLLPDEDARAWFSGNPDLAAETALRNGTLQGAYFLLAARAHGLDCGPMSGFDNARVDDLFLSDRGWKSNFLISLGHADRTAQTPRAPRFSFDDICLLL